MEIKNNTKFSKEGYYTLNKTMASKIYIACIVFELLLAIFLGFIIFKDKDYIKAIVIGVLMVGYPFLLSLIMNIQLKRNYNINKMAFESMVYDYTFTDENILIYCTNKNQTSESKLAYPAIYKLIDSEQYLFIFISSNQAYLIEKSGFESPQDVETIISKIKSYNIKYKYKKVKVK